MPYVLGFAIFVAFFRVKMMSVPIELFSYITSDDFIQMMPVSADPMGQVTYDDALPP